ncbi:hypothetical protein XENTR_v10012945 [Xenopus tropicalis]|nr:hypothetical protein XENTR_v10012945 [Xenopus tropicalis]
MNFTTFTSMSNRNGTRRLVHGDKIAMSKFAKKTFFTHFFSYAKCIKVNGGFFLGDFYVSIWFLFPQNFIFMGDLNAGCAYVPKKAWGNIRLRTHSEFVWLIGDKEDTTVKASTKCAYDRIVMAGDKLLSSVVPGSAQVFDFMAVYGLTEDQALEVSDHFPVEVQLKESKRPTSRRRKHIERK